MRRRRGESRYVSDNPPQVGGAGVFALSGDERVAEVALTAGVVGSSYDSEDLWGCPGISDTPKADNCQ